MKILWLILLVHLSTEAPMLPTDGYSIGWWTLDGGGEMWSTGGDFELSGTIGQPDANELLMTGGDFELTGGFWFAQAHGDCNYDAGINLFDFAGYDTCLSGPGAPHAADCECHDFDADGDVDLTDFGAFQAAFAGL
jgi:hypothetical protein